MDKKCITRMREHLQRPMAPMTTTAKMNCRVRMPKMMMGFESRPTTLDRMDRLGSDMGSDMGSDILMLSEGGCEVTDMASFSWLER